MENGSMNMEKDQQLVRSVWPEWDLMELLGYGQFGVVYKARKKGFAGSSYAAIKIVAIEYRSKDSGLNAEQTDSYLASVAQNYAREIQMMECVKGYTNIVNIEDYTVLKNSGGRPWYVLIRMELLTPLHAYLEEQTPGEKEIIRIGSDLCKALEICKTKKVVHRDIKPANVFVNGDGAVKLGDFGVARQITDYTFQTKTGTPDYMAPEVYNGSLNAADFDRAHRADLYSVGMLLYWIANGRRQPFIKKEGLITADQITDAFQKRMSGSPLPPPEGVSERLQRVILKACSFDPADRFQSAGQFREALEEGNAPELPEPETGPDSPAKADQAAGHPAAPQRRKRMICALLFLAAIIGTAAWLLSRNSTGGAGGTPSSGPAAVTDPGGEKANGPDACGENLRWEISGDVLTISGTGGMYDYSATDVPPWNGYKDAIRKVVVENGATKIGKYAFYRFPELTEVELPGSVTRINTMAFGYCNKLPSLTIPEGTEHIEESIIYRCPELKTVSLPGSIRLIEGSFAGECGNLTTITLGENCADYVVRDGVLFDAAMEELFCHPAGLEDLTYTIPDKVRIIGVYAFDENKNLLEVMIPDSVTTIDSCAFSGCRNLRSITVPDSVVSLGIYAFYGCEKLADVRLSGNITWIDQQAFYNCSSLQRIVIPGKVTRIGTAVFGNCYSLNEIVVPPSVTSIQKSAFEGSPNVLIICESGSYAEQFAAEQGIPCSNDVPQT